MADKSNARIREDTVNALQGFVLGGQLVIDKAGDEKRLLNFVGSTCTDAMRKLAYDYPIGTQFDIFIRKRE